MSRMSEMQEQKRDHKRRRKLRLHWEDVTCLWNVDRRVRIPVGLSSTTATLWHACLIPVRDRLRQPSVDVNSPEETAATRPGSRRASGAVSPTNGACLEARGSLNAKLLHQIFFPSPLCEQPAESFPLLLTCARCER